MARVYVDFIHGRPACGKDTQADLLVKQIPHSRKISGVYRSAFTQQGEYSQYHPLVQPYVKKLGEGICVPGPIVSEILQDILERGRRDGVTRFFVCGLLRTLDHKQSIDELEAFRNDFTARHIYLATSEARALRQTNVRFSEGQASRQTRPDDIDIYMRARLDRYRANTIPMLSEIESENRLCIVRADGPINEVHSKLKELLIPNTPMMEGNHMRASMMKR